MELSFPTFIKATHNLELRFNARFEEKQANNEQPTFNKNENQLLLLLHTV